MEHAGYKSVIYWLQILDKIEPILFYSSARQMNNNIYLGIKPPT